METSNQDQRSHLKIVLIVLMLFFILIALFDGLYPKIAHTVNKKLWEGNKPEHYYVRVHALTSDGCSWTWESVIHNNIAKLLTSTTFHSDEKRIYCSEVDWFLDSDKISVDHIFDVLEQTCVNRTFLNCGSTFDNKYHYPVQSQSYEVYIIEIEQFVECNVNQATCP